MDKKENTDADVIHTKLWSELASQDNPFAAEQCYCAGYNVYEDILGRSGWEEYVFLLFKGEKPDRVQRDILKVLAVALGNPGPRDPSVRAAMSAAAGGSTAASILIAAISVGAGQCGGAREVYNCMQNWMKLQRIESEKWGSYLKDSVSTAENSHSWEWPKTTHVAGFDINDCRCRSPVLKTLELISSMCPTGVSAWLQSNRLELEECVGSPVNIAGTSAAAFMDLGLSCAQGEIIYLILRLPGTAAHALEQHMQWKRYPFFEDKLYLVDDERGGSAD